MDYVEEQAWPSLSSSMPGRGGEQRTLRFNGKVDQDPTKVNSINENVGTDCTNHDDDDDDSWDMLINEIVVQNNSLVLSSSSSSSNDERENNPFNIRTSEVVEAPTFFTRDTKSVFSHDSITTDNHSKKERIIQKEKGNMNGKIPEKILDSAQDSSIDKIDDSLLSYTTELVVSPVMTKSNDSTSIPPMVTKMDGNDNDYEVVTAVEYDDEHQKSTITCTSTCVGFSKAKRNQQVPSTTNKNELLCDDFSIISSSELHCSKEFVSESVDTSLTWDSKLTFREILLRSNNNTNNKPIQEEEESATEMMHHHHQEQGSCSSANPRSDTINKQQKQQQQTETKVTINKNKSKPRFVVVKPPSRQPFNNTSRGACSKNDSNDNDDDDDDDDDGTYGYYGQKSMGTKGHTNGLKLRPDEAKRKQYIIDKKNLQRSGNA